MPGNWRRSDIPAWDSFAYINFIVAVEQEFGVKFGVAEVEAFETVGAIRDSSDARFAAVCLEGDARVAYEADFWPETI